ncbi:MAG: hypothetical protein HGB02_07785, partial [Chlorobiaceae bacterium]|nr:hypothetical protein [Chlorobiaceae bacterium]
GTGLGNYDISYVNGSLTITPKTLTVSGVTASDKVYNGTVAATIDTAGAALTGVIGSDSVTLTKTGATGSFLDKNVGTDKQVDIIGMGIDNGDYQLSAVNGTATADITAASLTITGGTTSQVYTGSAQQNSYSVTGGTLYSGDSISAISGSAQATHVSEGTVNDTLGGATGTGLSNYTITYVNGSMTITPKTLTVTGVTAENRIYDGTVAATIDTASAALSGIIGSDTVTLTKTGATGSFQNKNVGTGKQVEIGGMSVDNSDYQLAATNGTATADITAASLTITGGTTSQVYTGSAQTNSYSISTLYSGDTVTGVSGLAQATHVADGTVADTLGGATGTGLSNYTITYVNGSMTITPKTLTVTGVTAENRIYDGTVAATIDTASAALSGIIGSDTVTLTKTGATGSFQNKNIGTGKQVEIGGMSVDNSDYQLATVNGTATADITAAPLTITGGTTSQVYTGSAQTNSYSISTLYSGDTVTGVSGLAQATHVSDGTVADTLGGATGTGLSNYSISYVNGSMTITPKTLTVTGVTAENRIYDGTVAATIDTASAALSGIIGSDTVTLTKTGATGSFVNKNVGTGKQVDIGGMSVGGSSVGDYQLATVNGTATADITSASLTITGGTTSQVYTGSAQTNSYSITGTVYSGDTVTGVSGLAQATHVADGTVADTLGGATGTGLSNYTITYVNGSMTITPKTLTVTGVTAENRIYDGTVAATIDTASAALSGIIGSDTVTLTKTGATGSFQNKNVGTGKQVDIGGMSVDNSDYQLAATNGTATADITSAPLTFTGGTTSQVYTGSAQTNSYSITGTVYSGDTVTGVSGLAQATHVADGTVADTLGGATGTGLSNYTITYANGSMTITPKTLTVKPTATSVTYDGTTLNNATYSDSLGNYAITGWLSGEDATSTGLGLTGSMSFNGDTVTSVRNAGAYTLGQGTLGQSGASNYTLAFDNTANNAYTITPKLVTLTAGAVSKTYDRGLGYTTQAADRTSLSTQLGVIGDTVTAATISYADKNAGTDLTVTLDSVTIDDGNGGNNYTVTRVGNSESTILRKELTIDLQGEGSKVYDGLSSIDLDGITPTVVGVITDDTVDIVTGSVSGYVDKNVGSNKAVTYSDFVISGSDAGNYILGTGTSAISTANITPATLTLTAVSDTKSYDGGTSSIGVVSYSGLQSGDTLNGLTQSYQSKNVLGTNGSTLLVNSGYSLSDGNNGGNYTVVRQTAQGTINRATLTLTAASDTKTYDAGTGSSGVVSYSGLQSGDTLTGLTQSYQTRHVLGTNGSTLLVNGGYSLSDGNNGGNYTVVTQSAQGTITPKTLTVSITGTPAKAYDGTTLATLSPANYQIAGLQGSDSFTITKTSGSYNSADASVANTVAVSLSTGDYAPRAGTSSGDYQLASLAVGPGVITGTHTPVTVPTGLQTALASSNIVWRNTVIHNMNSYIRPYLLMAVLDKSCGYVLNDPEMPKMIMYSETKSRMNGKGGS